MAGEEDESQEGQEYFVLGNLTLLAGIPAGAGGEDSGGTQAPSPMQEEHRPFLLRRDASAINRLFNALWPDLGKPQPMHIPCCWR